MFKKGTGYSKACLVWLMLVCRLGKKYFIFFQPKYLATIDITPPNCLLEKNWFMIQSFV